jgi:hypothetical protein
MAPYVFKRNNEGIHIVNLGKTWEKLMLAARIIAAIPNPRDVLVSTISFKDLFLTGSLYWSNFILDRWRLPLIDCFKQRLRLKSRP